ncbi:hypothetical protein K505DRAFT_251488 [Melanomma pulvis-pyrius CBS 109.77]|uniref:Uncharacterized protein n=1 Tax=Melanomma pulvis-pyrius CBS 109.77 TaxID=1314802 RepID=A0A6A6X1T7_9PLEO|nr:hypothetical protein K505DRAFT_251488 [Melanomma pulvis-pyrius CBS 109.77]
MPRQPFDEEAYRAQKAAFIADLEKEPEFQILSTLVQQADTDKAPADAVQQTLHISESGQIDRSEGLGDHFYSTACCILEVALRSSTPEQQAALVDFVNALQKTTVVDPTSATGELLRYGGDLVWTELPAFGFTFGDELQNPLDPSNTSEERQRIENLNAFIAQLTASSSTTHTDFSNWALVAFRLAFGPWDTPRPATTHYSVRVACQWYIHASDKLWAKFRDEESGWKEEDWARYKQGLVDSHTKLRNLETKKLIAEALVQLRRAEGGGT